MMAEDEFDDQIEDATIENWEDEDEELTNPNLKNTRENQLRVIRTNQDYNLDYL
jgi:hypothetical protein